MITLENFFELHNKKTNYKSSDRKQIKRLTKK